MTVLLHLTEPRLAKLAWRLDAGRKFTVGVPDRAVRLTKRWRLCIVLAHRTLPIDDGEVTVGDSADGPFVVAIARVRASPRSTTTDERLMVQRSHSVLDALAVSDLFEALPAEHRRSVSSVIDAVATDLGESATSAFQAALDRLRPGLGAVVADLLPSDAEPIDGTTGANLALERDAVRLALNIAGLEVDLDSDWVEAGNNYLASLAYEPREDVMTAFDANRFPDFDALPGGRPDWLTFSDGERHLRIANVDSTALENRLGVDLIYRHVEADTFVLVQYKKMVKESDGDWWYRPDAQLKTELTRMRVVDGEAHPHRGDAHPVSWRLHPRACFLKLVAPPRVFDPTSDRLLSGIYLPLAYLEELLADDSTLGPRGGRRLGYANVDRYLTTGLFTALVREGWVGSRGVTTRAIQTVVEAALESERSVVIAEEAGHVPGATRRAGPRR